MSDGLHRFPQVSLGWAVLVALILHWGFSQLSVPPGPTGWPSALQPKDKGEIVVESLDETRQTIVQTQKSPPATGPEAKAEFGGEIRNRVDQQTQSRLRGRFREGVAQFPKGHSPETPSPDGELPSEAEGRQESLSMRSLLPSRSPHSLPKEIVEGDSTQLNTDPVRYASFINRIADEIYDPWVANARMAVRTILDSGRKLEANTYVTRLSVVLNAEGEVMAIRILKSSGIRELDDAPKDAFWRVESFKNPPTQMFDSEDQLHFDYEFHFEWNTAGFRIVPSVI